MRALSPPAERVRPARTAAAQFTTDGVSRSMLMKRGPVERGNDAKFQAEYMNWQGWARRYARSIGAASFNALVISDMCGRCDIRVEERIAGEWNPTSSIEWDGIIEDYANELQDPDELVRVHAWHYQVAGEMVCVTRDTDYGVAYGIHSTSAVVWDAPNEGEATIKLVPDGKVEKDTAFVVPRAQVVRFWMPDQEWQAYAWSPMAASINDLKRYDALARTALKTADSTLAMAGLLWGPGEAHQEPAGGDEDEASAEDAGTPRSKLEELYYSVAAMRASDSEDVTSIAPPFLHWDKDWGPPQYVKLGDPLDPNGIAYRTEALEDFARAGTLPVTTVVGGGVGDANHWSEWLASRKMFDSGVAPTMDRITHLDMTRTFLWPRAILGGYEKPQLRNLRIGYDPQPVIVKPDNSENALKLYLAGLLDDVPTLEACGFDKADLMADPTKKAWLLEVIGRAAAAQGLAPNVVTESNVRQLPPSTEGTPVAASAEPRPFAQRSRRKSLSQVVHPPATDQRVERLESRLRHVERSAGSRS